MLGKSCQSHPKKGGQICCNSFCLRKYNIRGKNTLQFCSHEFPAFPSWGPYSSPANSPFCPSPAATTPAAFHAATSTHLIPAHTRPVPVRGTNRKPNYDFFCQSQKRRPTAALTTAFAETPAVQAAIWIWRCRRWLHARIC